MARKPVHLLAAGGKPYGRQAIWQQIRQLRSFTLLQLADAVKINVDTVETYVKSLVNSGHLVVTGSVPAHEAVRGRRPGKQVAKLYELAKDVGVEAPRVRRDGSLCLQGRPREQMWRAMRMLGDFNPRELAVAASTDEAPVADVDAADYVKHLAMAGYLVVIEASTPKRQARYRFVKARWSGPKPPMVQRLKSVFDPNLGKVVWHQEVDA